jgi:hypothetical protein
MPRLAILLFLVLAFGCASDDTYSDSGRYSTMAFTGNELMKSAGQAAPLDPTRPIADRNCAQPIDASAGGNLRCQ